MKAEDYSKYLSIDNGKGLLIRRNDANVMDRYNIDYHSCSSMQDLIFLVGLYLDDNYEEELDELEDVMNNLMELHYYNEVNK